MRALRWLLFTLLVVAVYGCGEPLKQAKDGRRPKVYNSVISLSPGTTEILAIYGNPAIIRGKTLACNYPYSIRGLTVVADTKPNVELIATLEPDVQMAIYDDALYSEADLAKLAELGIELEEWGPDKVADMPSRLLELGSRLGFEHQFAAYADKIEQAVDFARGAAPATKPKVALLMGDYIAGVDSFYADLVRSSGGEPVGPSSDKYDPLNAEMLVEQNPDVILDLYSKPFDAYVEETTDPREQEKRRNTTLLRRVRGDLLSDPRFQSIAAIKNKHVASVHPDVFARRGARVDTAIRELATYLGIINE